MEIKYLLGMAAGAGNSLLAIWLSMDSLKDWKQLLVPAHWTCRWKSALVLGALFGLYEIWLFESLGRDFWSMLILWGCMLSASLTDIDRHEISVFALWVYGLMAAVCQISSLNLAVCINALLGAALGAVFLGLPHILRPESIGLGDVFLLAVCGLGTGFPGVIYVLARSLIALVVVSMIQLARKKVTVRSEMPLAPFLLFGVLI